MRQSILVALLSLTALVPVGKSQDPAKQNELVAGIQHLMDVHVGFERMVPAGMSIEAKEISRTGKSGEDLVVQYHIFVTGVPPGILFRQIEWPVNADKPSSPLWGISVGKDGVLMCAGRTPEQCGDLKKPDDPIEFITRPAKGEPSRVAFVAPNVKIGTVLVPDPIQSSDKGCTLNAVRLTPEFEFAFLSGSGYAPNGDVHFRISSETTTEQVVKSDATGSIRVSVTPYPAKRNKGVVKVKIVEPRCSPELSYGWGHL